MCQEPSIGLGNFLVSYISLLPTRRRSLVSPVPTVQMNHSEFCSAGPWSLRIGCKQPLSTELEVELDSLHASKKP